jgi:hypothetical protein
MAPLYGGTGAGTADRGRYGHIQDWTGHDVVARKTRIHKGCDYTGPVHWMPTPVRAGAAPRFTVVAGNSRPEGPRD